MDRDALRRVNKLLIDLKKRLDNAILTGAIDGWDLLHIPRLKQAVNLVILQFQSKYGMDIINSQNEAFELGILLVDEPLSVYIPTLALPQMSRTTLSIWQGYSADLVTGLSKDMTKWVNSELTLGITGERSPFEVVKALGKKLKGYNWEYGTPIQKAQRRAEVIVRTELSRVLNNSTNLRQKQVGENYPEVKKYWMQNPSKYPRDTHKMVARATDPNLGGEPIPINYNFNVSGYSVSGPHAPGLPAKEVIQCGCRSIIYYEE